MAIFEKGPAARRFYSLSSDPRPTAEGGIPTGSFLQHTDTGDRFIYNQPTNIWYPFVGEEDLLSVLVDIKASLETHTELLILIQGATGALANELANCIFPTGDE